jgi:hypothetical protein
LLLLWTGATGRVLLPGLNSSSTKISSPECIQSHDPSHGNRVLTKAYGMKCNSSHDRTCGSPMDWFSLPVEAMGRPGRLAWPRPPVRTAEAPCTRRGLRDFVVLRVFRTSRCGAPSRTFSMLTASPDMAFRSCRRACHMRTVIVKKERHAAFATKVALRYGLMKISMFYTISDSALPDLTMRCWKSSCLLLKRSTGYAIL